MIECLPSGGWFSLGLRPRENHPPFGETFHHVTPTGMAYLYNIVLYKRLGRPGKQGYCEETSQTLGGIGYSQLH